MSSPNFNHSSKSIEVRVLFFGAARDAVGKGELQFQLKEPATAQSALEELVKTFPDLGRFGRSLLLAVNQEYARVDLEVGDGDELALFPPVSGGEGISRR